MTIVVSCNPAVMLGGSNSVKARQQAMWAAGDFAVIGTTLQIVGELLCEAADVQATDRVLDRDHEVREARWVRPRRRD